MIIIGGVALLLSMTNLAATYALNNKSLKKYAMDLGLDITAFNQCLDSGSMLGEVQKDFQEGSRLGIRGTPTFFDSLTRIETIPLFSKSTFGLPPPPS